MYTLDELITRYPVLEKSRKDIIAVQDALVNLYKNNGKLLVCGNGGSCADSNHIAGELMKGFKQPRNIPANLKDNLIKIDQVRGKKIADTIQQGLPCIALDNHNTLNTAFINDVDNGGAYLYAQQVNVYGAHNDVLLVITTSGNSENIINAAITAKAKGLKVISLTGKDGGEIKKYADISIIVDGKETFKIQELHLPIYHYLCLYLENYFFNK